MNGSYDVTVYDIGSDGAIHNQPAIDYGVVYLIAPSHTTSTTSFESMYTILCKSVPNIASCFVLMYMYITVTVTDTTIIITIDVTNIPSVTIMTNNTTNSHS